ncbi:hypothetical protein DXA12_14355 [Ruminococcus sp. AM57-5]|nr:hypothetical protein DXA12_14355 [Ruminococcus sp. AM57-5]
MHISKPISKERSTYRKKEIRSNRHRKKGVPSWGTDWQRGILIFSFFCTAFRQLFTNCLVQVRLDMGCAPLNSGRKEWYKKI